MSYQPIENYGVIGDLHTVALVGMDGSIDFMCAPRFDSPSVFAALLDAERGGRFQLAPLLEGARRKQLYLPDTCVLLTRFLSDAGVAEVSDFMPIEDGRQVMRPGCPFTDLDGSTCERFGRGEVAASVGQTGAVVVERGHVRVHRAM